MTLVEVKTKLKTTGLPVAYRAFKGPVNPPFIAYFVDSEEVRGSDHKNLIVDRDLVIEFYSDSKEEATERAIENLFNGFDVSKTEEWIESEKMLQVVFYINDVFKL